MTEEDREREDRNCINYVPIRMNGASKYDQISNFIKTVGFPVAVVCYFLIKDWIFTEKLLGLLARISLALDRMGVVVNP